MICLINKSLFYRILVLSTLVLLQIGCQPSWKFSIVSMDDPLHPLFCISEGDNCRGKGVGFPIFDVVEVDNSGNLIKRMWAIEAVEKVKLNKFSYGTAPQGYKELEPAKSLELNKLYRVHGEFFFTLYKQDSQVKAKVFNFREFSDKIKKE